MVFTDIKTVDPALDPPVLRIVEFYLVPDVAVGCCNFIQQGDDIAVKEYSQAFITGTGTGSDIDIVAGDGTGIASGPLVCFPEACLFGKKRDFIKEKRCQIRVFGSRISPW